MKVISTALLLTWLSINTNGLKPVGRISNRNFGRTLPPVDATSVKAIKGAIDSINQYANMHKDINNLYKQNEAWVKEKERGDPDYFNELGSGHKPSYLWIGCSDARVPANEVMGEDAGSVFVVRNVANTVCGTDFSLQSALQYAVRVLEVPHIIVCGHYDCGGVRASMKNQDHVPPLEDWLRNIRDVYRLHQKELDSIKDPEKRHRRLVELNVVEQCINLYKTGPVQAQRMETSRSSDYPFGIPRIHACVFDPKDGILKPLQIDFERFSTQISDIYTLY